MPDTPSTPPDAQEISGVISRINQLGAATERLFSRLYAGLNYRQQHETEAAARQRRRAELEAKIAAARRVFEKNQALQVRVSESKRELEHLTGILESLDEGIIMQDNDGRIALINRAARDLLGSQKNFWDTELGTLFSQHSNVSSLDNELTPLGSPTKVQINKRVVGAQLAAVANDRGERLGTMIVLRDVTRDSNVDRLKDQFVTAISHELKTPMTVIKGMSEVLLAQSQSQDSRLLETLSRNVDILDRMVVELLDISEMGAGSFSIRRDVVPLEPLIWSVVNGMAPEVKRSKLDVAIMLRDVEKLRISGDERRLRWAIGHLVQNAVRYNEPGGHVMVAAGVDDEDPDYVVINVIDTGVGISEKDLPHVFDHFYRGEPRNTSGKLLDPRGLGQGLYVARTVAEAHSGLLRVSSEPGDGSIFTLILPTAHAQ